jgi:hypothetical protein
LIQPDAFSVLSAFSPLPLRLRERGMARFLRLGRLSRFSSAASLFFALRSPARSRLFFFFFFFFFWLCSFHKAKRRRLACALNDAKKDAPRGVLTFPFDPGSGLPRVRLCGAAPHFAQTLFEPDTGDIHHDHAEHDARKNQSSEAEREHCENGGQAKQDGGEHGDPCALTQAICERRPENQAKRGLENKKPTVLIDWLFRLKTCQESAAASFRYEVLEGSEPHSLTEAIVRLFPSPRNPFSTLYLFTLSPRQWINGLAPQREWICDGAQPNGPRWSTHRPCARRRLNGERQLALPRSTQLARRSSRGP